MITPSKCYLALASACAVFASSAGYANSINADLNNEAVHIRYNATNSSQGLELAVAAILTEDKGEAFFVGAQTNSQLQGMANIRGGFGARLYHLSNEGGDGFQSLTLGGALALSIPEVEGLSVDLALYYGPSITTTGDPDNFSDFNLRVNYKVFQNAAIYTGWRDIEADYNNNSYTFDDGVFVGFEIDF